MKETFSRSYNLKYKKNCQGSIGRKADALFVAEKDRISDQLLFRISVQKKVIFYVKGSKLTYLWKECILKLHDDIHFKNVKNVKYSNLNILFLFFCPSHIKRKNSNEKKSKMQKPLLYFHNGDSEFKIFSCINIGINIHLGYSDKYLSICPFGHDG